ncbi:MAG: GNAT family N-acetyltransferase [Phycisphaerae bacterium]|nr:GNAT family N-acetyltransferase [Phycisphaerae bacterium]
MSNQSTLHVRDARPDDAAMITEFNCGVAWDSEHITLDRNRVRAGVDKALGRPDLCRYFVAERNGELIGQVMITLEWSDWRAKVFWWIQSVYVAAACRRQGVMRAMLEHVESLARQDPEVCGLRLYVEQDNKAAIRAYERLGLTPSGHVIYERDWAWPKGS